MITKLTLPQKILFLLKRKDMCQFRHKLTFLFSLWSLFTRNLPFWHNSYKINPPSKKILFLPKKKGHVSIFATNGRFVFLLSFAEKEGCVCVLPKIPFQTWISDTFLSLNSASRRNWTRHWIASKSSERKSMNIFSIISFLLIF